MASLGPRLPMGHRDGPWPAGARFGLSVLTATSRPMTPSCGSVRSSWACPRFSVGAPRVSSQTPGSERWPGCPAACSHRDAAFAHPRHPPPRRVHSARISSLLPASWSSSPPLPALTQPSCWGQARGLRRGSASNLEQPPQVASLITTISHDTFVAGITPPSLWRPVVSLAGAAIALSPSAATATATAPRLASDLEEQLLVMPERSACCRSIR